MNRPCPKCGKPCELRCGRLSRKWFWNHPVLTPCPNSSSGRIIWHDTRESAEHAPEMFKGRKERVS